MSLLDIRHAKEALTWRLREWGCDDPAERAASFIDDLVTKGWRMDANREDRPQPPKAGEECPRCGGPREFCGCQRERRAVDYEPETPGSADLASVRAAMEQARAGLCGHGVPFANCKQDHDAEEASA